jgi:dihydropteroate synthase
VITIVGILNCTPDSFSDGDPDATDINLYDKALRLIDEGADVIDIGGDSTRPGSVCVDLEEEWQRIGKLIERLAARIPVCIDTHKVEIARRALMCGARFINDVAGGTDPALINLVAASNAQYIFMYSASSVPHIFVEGPSKDEVMNTLNSWMRERIEALNAVGIPSERLIADTGMGAFVSRDPEVSFEIFKRYGELEPPCGGLMLGCSRKGFLKREGERKPSDRDALSSLYGILAASKLTDEVPFYIRVHNVALQRACVDAWKGSAYE